MHTYGNWPDKNFEKIENAAGEIGDFISKWGRMNVFQAKEKFGTVRVYCSFGHHFFFPYQKFIYRLAYKRAVKKYPKLWKEILVMADWGELLDGIAGYKYSEHWKEVK